MSVREIRPYLEAWHAEGDRAAIALLTECWSSAPRRPGARFARSESGSIGGNISAGCVEADLALRLDAVLAGEPGDLVSYGISDETAAGVGLACGGRIQLHLEAWSPDSPVWPVLFERLDARAPVVLVTAIGRDERAHWLLDASGALLASDGPESPSATVVEAGHELLSTGGARVLEVTGEPDVFVEALLPARRLIVIGATPVGAALARLASMAAVPVAVVEPREAYGGSLAELDIEVVRLWPDEAFDRIRPDASCAVAVVAHDERIDVQALSGALVAQCPYVGLLGGRRTRESRRASLLAAGHDESLVDRISAPIGLDIGGERPEEIAVGILAEIIGV
ncbi:MAG: XdhC family protein, partial [Gemmatimonadota bacterium]